MVIRTMKDLGTSLRFIGRRPRLKEVSAMPQLPQPCAPVAMRGLHVHSRGLSPTSPSLRVFQGVDLGPLPSESLECSLQCRFLASLQTLNQTL